MALAGLSPQRIWAAIAIAVMAILGFIYLLRVNPPASFKDKNELPERYSEGEIVNGRIFVETGRLLTFPIKLNRRRKLVGNFTVLTKNSLAAGLVLREKDFELLEAGNDFERLAATGYVPMGAINAALEPGNYQLVFDNRAGTGASAEIQAVFKLE